MKVSLKKILILENASELKNNEVFKRIIFIKIYQRRTEKIAKMCGFEKEKELNSKGGPTSGQHE